MSRFFGAFKRPVLCALALALCPFAHGQAVFSGGEFRAAEPLVGDQSFPGVAISPNGGWLVWQDNASDGRGKGLGVRAQRLAADFSRVGSPFQVNKILPEDQERPQVAVLPDGGAVFVWQGGKRNAQRIYARFASASGVLTGGDLRVNTFNKGSQSLPAVAVLADGNLVVVWSSFDQEGSLSGVFGQRLNSRGGRIGREFQINQFTANNQRNPAVAALAGGGFVVVWVSELQQSATSISIFARLFDAAGVPVGDEFAVTPETVRIAANPAVAGLDNGGFAVAWNARDLPLRNSPGLFPASETSGTGWDIFARHHHSDGTAATAPYRVNTETFGDQFAPRVAALGEGLLVIWTSLGQDGSWEGIFGQAVRANGAAVDAEFRLNATTLSRQMHPALAGDGRGQALAVWTSFGATTSFDLFARAFEGVQSILTTTEQGVLLQWWTRTGAAYQVQTSPDGGATWSNFGVERAGTGAPDGIGITEDKSTQYRVVRVR